MGVWEDRWSKRLCPLVALVHGAGRVWGPAQELEMGRELRKDRHSQGNEVVTEARTPEGKVFLSHISKEVLQGRVYWKI
jgi:hypothetical protein